MADAAGKMCAHCGVQAKYRCAKCKSSWYCSDTCQKQAWPSHKATCVSAPVVPIAYAVPPAEERCKGCGGWGLGVVQEDGHCAHCSRTKAETA